MAASCGFESRPGGAVDAGTDGPVDDGPSNVCYGPSGAWRVCLRAAPTSPLTLPARIDTDKSELCLRDQPAGWMPSQPAACFVLGATIMTSQGATEVTGSRALVLLAHTTIEISSLLDFAGHRADNDNPAIASPEAPCRTFTVLPGGGNGGGGGAGGSFLTRAGSGGRGGGNVQNGQATAEDPDPPARLRGGCPGQVGGSRAQGEGGAGRGGGALYLLAGDRIAISGTVNASGAGGSGGGPRTGGSGGGSGGMIVLHASSIALSGTLIANGGGGAGGGTQNERGDDGQDPQALMPMQPADGGGNGGQGFPAEDDVLDGTGGTGPNDGGGGGGGASGYIRANHDLEPARVSPTASIITDDLVDRRIDRR